MNLHTDVPTRAQAGRLLEHRRSSSVSIYLPTDPVPNGQPESTELGNLAAEAERQLVPLILAVAEPLDSIFRSVSTYPLAVRRDEVPGGGTVAAILRYPLARA